MGEKNEQEWHPRQGVGMVEVPLHVVQAMQRVCEAAKALMDYDDPANYVGADLVIEGLRVALADLERARKGMA